MERVTVEELGKVDVYPVGLITPSCTGILQDEAPLSTLVKSTRRRIP